MGIARNTDEPNEVYIHGAVKTLFLMRRLEMNFCRWI